MGHRLIQQRRGRGTPTYTAPSHRYFGKIKYASIIGKTIRGEVLDIVNSVGHSAPLMLVKYETGQLSLLPAPLGIKKGEQVFAGDDAPVQRGCVLRLADIPTGTSIFNIERKPYDGGQLVRTSGTAAQVTGREADKVIVRLPSKKTIAFLGSCRATVGIIAGGGRKEKPFIKGGKHHIARKARGKMHPRVSGVAMNVVDHPHGGTHRRTKGRPSTIARGTPPGRKVGLLAAKKSGRGK